MRTLTLCSNLLKTVYRDLWSDALNYGTPLRAQLMKKRVPMTGRSLTFPVKYALVQSGGARGDNQDLPAPGASKEYPSTFNAKQNYWTVGWTGMAVAATENKAAAFANAFTSEMADAQKAFMLDLNRQMWGDGQCTLCLANGDPGGGLTLTVDNGISATDGTSRRLYAGMVIDGWTSTTKEIDGVEIGSVDSATAATVLSNISCTDDAKIVRHDNREAASYHELTGLAGLIGDSGTVQAINSDTAAYAWWKSPGMQTTLGTLDTQDMINCCQKVSQKRSDGAMPNLIATTDGVINSYREIIEDDVRLNPLEIYGGYKAIGFWCGGAEIPMITDLDCPEGEMDFLSTDQLEMHELLAMKWDDRFGTEFYPTHRRDSWEARMVYYSNLMTRARWAHSRLSGITETTT